MKKQSAIDPTRPEVINLPADFEEDRIGTALLQKIGVRGHVDVMHDREWGISHYRAWYKDPKTGQSYCDHSDTLTSLLDMVNEIIKQDRS